MATNNGKGIQNFFIKAADQVIASATLVSIALGGTTNPVTTGIPIAAGQRLKVRYWVKFTVGATGGVRAQVLTPAATTNFQSTIRLNNTVAPSQTIATQQATAAFTNALANAGTHWLEIEVYVENGVNAGTIDLQMGQNTTDALTLTVIEGATADITKI